MKKATVDPRTRFLRSVQFPAHEDGCWLWTKGRTNTGHGGFWYEGATMGAHRAAYKLFVGPVAPRIHVHHKCKNKLCVRPDHLTLLTIEEHAKEHEFGGLGSLVNAEKTHCPRGHEYTPENTRVGKSGSRFCRACKREKTRERREEMRRENPPTPRGSHMKARTHCPYGHEYTPENTYTNPQGSRACRACKKERRRVPVPTPT